MVILEDTRNQINKHNLKHRYFAEHGITVMRQALLVGDYTLPTNQSVCIDTKKDLQECVSNICGKEHERFRDECIRAQQAGIKLIILVEDDTTDDTGRYIINEVRDVRLWQNPRRNIWTQKDGRWVRKYPRVTSGKVLMKAMFTMQLRYGVAFEFVRKNDAGKRIVEILTKPTGE